MKKLITFLVLVTGLFSYSQNSLEIIHKKDDMTDKEYWYPSRKLIVENKQELKAFGITFHISKEDTGEIKITMIDAKLVGFKCVDRVKFIFMFENDEKINKVSFLKFNCDGNGATWLTDEDLKKFSSLKVKKIRVTNGLDNSELTGDVLETDYFIKLVKLVNEKKFIEK